MNCGIIISMMGSSNKLKRLFQISLVLQLLMLAQGVNPSGDNTCIIDETFNVTVQVNEEYQQQYTDSKWCINIPPRCTVYKWRWATRVVPKVVSNTRQITRCCAGYVENLDGECKASCEEPCRHGACTMPNTCTCFPGFKGRLCQELCTRKTWGRNCTQQCECQNGAFCNPMNGSCLCPPGWRGQRCGEPCKDGYFGMDCRLPCYCTMGENLSCHHITGECTIPTTTEIFTTTDLITTTTELDATSQTYSTTETAEESTSTDVSSTTESFSSDELITTTGAITSTESSTSGLPLTRGPTTGFPEMSSTDLTSSSFPASYTEVTYRNSTPVNNIMDLKVTVLPEMEQESKMEVARLAITITLSILGSLILLFAAAGLALSRQRKLPTGKQATSDEVLDVGLYSCCTDTLPAPADNIVIPNPSYGFGHYQTAMENVHFPTFRINEDTSELEIRDILEERYDYPTSSASFDHVYAEINSAAHKNIYKNI